MSHLQQLDDAMGMAGDDCLLIRKIVPTRGLCNASFQGAFETIAGEIVSAVVHTQPCKGPRFAQPDSGEVL